MPTKTHLQRICAVVVLGALLLPATVTAQDFSELPADVKPGALLRVLEIDGHETRGTLVAVTPDTLTLDIAGSRVTIAARTTARIQQRDSSKNGRWIGALTGGAAGVASGALLYTICVNETGNCGAVIPMMAGMGAGAGALIGSGLDRLNQRVIFNTGSELRFPNEATSELFGNLAWGRVDSHGSTNATPQVGAGWGVQFANGVGVEFDVVRSTDQSRQAVSCVTLRYATDSTCLGEGTHSLQSVTVASSKLGYSFMRRSPIQPFVTVGAGWASYRQTRTFASQPFSSGTYDPKKPVHLADVSGFGNDGLVGMFGGGVRVPLGQSLALRTEVTMYPLNRSAQAGMVRGSVGFGYRW